MEETKEKQDKESVKICGINLLSSGAKPKDVQELLGHSDVSTTMNIYAQIRFE